MSHEQFIADPINAEYPRLTVEMDHATPETGTNFKGVIEVFRRDEDIRVKNKLAFFGHGRYIPSLLAYS